MLELLNEVRVLLLHIIVQLMAVYYWGASSFLSLYIAVKAYELRVAFVLSQLVVQRDGLVRWTLVGSEHLKLSVSVAAYNKMPDCCSTNILELTQSQLVEHRQVFVRVANIEASEEHCSDVLYLVEYGFLMGCDDFLQSNEALELGRRRTPYNWELALVDRSLMGILESPKNIRQTLDFHILS